MTKNKLFIIIISIAACNHIASDIYVPSLPAITAYFVTSSDLVQITISIYLFVVALVQLIYGPLSDYYGRRRMLFIGAVIGMLGTSICITAVSIHWLIIGRVCQASGLGAFSLASRTMMSDIFTGRELAKYGSYIPIIISMFLAIAPVIGGYLQQYVGWQGAFGVILIYILFCVYLIKIIPETNQHIHQQKLNFANILISYKKILSDKVFMTASLSIGLAFATLLSYVVVSPFLLQDLAGLSPVAYGWTNILIPITMIIMGFLNSKLIYMFEKKNILFFGAMLVTMAGVIMSVPAFYGILNPWFIISPTIICVAGFVLIMTNCYTIALDLHKKSAGIAGALLGMFQLLGGSIGSGIVALFTDTTQLPLAFAYFAVGVMVLILHKGQLEHYYNCPSFDKICK